MRLATQGRDRRRCGTKSLPAVLSGTGHTVCAAPFTGVSGSHRQRPAHPGDVSTFLTVTPGWMLLTNPHPSSEEMPGTLLQTPYTQDSPRNKESSGPSTPGAGAGNLRPEEGDEF